MTDRFLARLRGKVVVVEEEDEFFRLHQRMEPTL